MLINEENGIKTYEGKLHFDGDDIDASAYYDNGVRWVEVKYSFNEMPNGDIEDFDYDANDNLGSGVDAVNDLVNFKRWGEDYIEEECYKAEGVR